MLPYNYGKSDMVEKLSLINNIAFWSIISEYPKYFLSDSSDDVEGFPF